MSPDSEIVAGIRKEIQISFYEICAGLNNHITREMDRLVYHVRCLIDQNKFLYDRVIKLEQRDDPQKVPRRNRNVHDLQKRQSRIHAGSSESMADLQRSATRRRMHSPYRQAG